MASFLGKIRTSRGEISVLMHSFCVIAEPMPPCVSGLLTALSVLSFGKWNSTNLQHCILHKETFLARLLQRKMETSKQQCLVDVQPTTATNPVTPNSIDFSSWPSNKTEARATEEQRVSVHILIRIPPCSLGIPRMPPLHVGLIFTWHFLTAGAVLVLP